MMLYNSRMHLFPGNLKSRWSGPFKVTEVLDSGVVEVENNKGEQFKVNGQRLKKYYGKPTDILVVYAMKITND